jgi:GxxExxY protein
MVPEHLNELARRVVGAAIEVHRHLGPGYAEAVYESALAVELELRDVPFQRQVPFRVAYKGRPVGQGRIDVLVAGELIVELKAVDRLNEVHFGQALGYLRATKRTLALVINFNVPVLLRGVKRILAPTPNP